MKDTKKVLQPVIEPTVINTASETILQSGDVEVLVAGAGTIITTKEMWDRFYSKREKFTLKKK